MYCKRCGVFLKDTSIYCSKCGCQVTRVDESADANQEMETLMPYKKALSIQKKIGIGVILLVGLSAIILYAVNVTKSKNGNEQKNTTKNITEDKVDSEKETAPKEEVTSEEEIASMPAYGTLLDYLNRPLSEVEATYGTDYVLEEGLYFGGEKRFYYEDQRVKAIFAVESSNPDVPPQGFFPISRLYLYEGDLGKGLRANMSIAEIEDLGYVGTRSDDLILSLEVYKITLDQIQLEYCYSWEENAAIQYVICTPLETKQQVEDPPAESEQHIIEGKEKATTEDSLEGREDEFVLLGVWTEEENILRFDETAPTTLKETPDIQFEVISVSADESEIELLYTGKESLHNMLYPGEIYVAYMNGLTSKKHGISKYYEVRGIGLRFTRYYHAGNRDDIRDKCEINEEEDLWRAGPNVQ